LEDWHVPARGQAKVHLIAGTAMVNAGPVRPCQDTSQPGPAGVSLIEGVHAVRLGPSQGCGRMRGEARWR